MRLARSSTAIYKLEGIKWRARQGHFQKEKEAATRLVLKGAGTAERRRRATWEQYNKCATCEKLFVEGDTVCSKRAGRGITKLRHVECARRVGLID